MANSQSSEGLPQGWSSSEGVDAPVLHGDGSPGTQRLWQMVPEEEEVVPTFSVGGDDSAAEDTSEDTNTCDDSSHFTSDPIAIPCGVAGQCGNTWQQNPGELIALRV